MKGVIWTKVSTFYNDHKVSWIGKYIAIMRNKDLKVFKTFNEDLFKEMTLLFTMGNFRENEQLSKYTDTKTAKNCQGCIDYLAQETARNKPHLQDKCQFPAFKNSRLRLLINQSINWQRQLCKNPKSNPEIKTLYLDHSCVQQTNAAQASSLATNQIPNSMLRAAVS